MSLARRSAPFAFAAALLAAGCASMTGPRADAPAAERDWFIFLETGKKTPDDKPRVQEMQRGHIDNFKRLFAEKKLFAAGPLRDPSGVKRGIVVVRAPDPTTLATYFQPDEYVREGYMTLNTTPVRVIRPLNTEGIDPNSIEEVRIVMVNREAALDEGRLQSALGEGRFGAAYQLESGPLAYILFARDKDEARLRDWLGVADAAKVQVWGQWLGKGVVK